MGVFLKYKCRIESTNNRKTHRYIHPKCVCVRERCIDSEIDRKIKKWIDR